MKQALLLAGLLLAATGAARAQALRGGYIDYDPKGSRGLMQFSFYWFGEGRFEYQTSGCGMAHDAGTFEQTADSLILHPYAYPPFTPPPVAGCPTPAAPGRSVRVWDAVSRQPLPYVTVLKRHTSSGLTTDSVGWGRLPDAVAPSDTVDICLIGFIRQALRVPAPTEPFQVVLLPNYGYGFSSRRSYSLTEWRTGIPWHGEGGYHPASRRITRRWRRHAK